MPSPLDPFGAFVDRWVDATTWWVEPVTRTSAALRDRMSPERMLAELVDGVLGRFGGQQVELVLRGQPVRGLLESLRVVGRDRALGVIADLSAVDWTGPPLAHLQARARGVRVTPGVPASLDVDGVDLQGRCEIDEAVRWAEGRTGPWTVGVDPRGHLRADRVDRPVGLSAEPAFVDGQLELELRAARWRGVEVRVPRWLRLTRTQPLPALPPGLRILDAHRAGHDVWFRLDVAGGRSTLDLNRLRDAIMRAPVPVG